MTEQSDLIARLAQRDALVERLAAGLAAFVQANGHADNCGPALADDGSWSAHGACCGAYIRCHETLALIKEAKAGAS